MLRRDSISTGHLQIYTIELKGFGPFCKVDLNSRNTIHMELATLKLLAAIREELSPQNKALARSMQLIDAEGTEADVVSALLYLASERARFVTGETLRVTGGMAAGV